MRNPKFWLGLLAFLMIFGCAFAVGGFALVVGFDRLFHFLLPEAILAASAVLIGAGLFALAADIVFFGAARRLNRRAALHSLIYTVETSSGQRRRRGEIYNNA